MSERNLEIIREYRFDPKEVIKGLNGYYESDKCNSYITIRRNDVESPAYLSTLYLSALIEWLREDFDIFYRPGLTPDQIEAARSAAKMCCLRAHIKDEISKRGLWCGADEDIPELVDTLFRAYDEEGERADKNRKEVVKLSKENIELRKEVKDIILQDIMDYIRQEASRNGFELPKEIDGEPLTIKRVFHDLLELLRMKETRIRNAEREARKAVNDQLKKDTDYVADTLCDILEALGISKSNTVHLDVFGLKTKAIQRASVIKSEHDRYQEQLGKATADYQALNEENQKLKIELNTLKDTVSGVRARLNSKFIPLPGYEDDLEKLADIALRAVEARDETINRITRPWHDECEDAKKEAKQECYKYLLNRLRALSPECDALKITDYEELVDRIFYEMSLINDNCKRCQRKHTTEKFDYIQRTNKAEEEVKKLKEQKDRAAAILQDLYRDIFKKQPNGLSAEDIANKILDKVLETEDLLHLESVDNYKLGLKDYILKDIKEHGYRYDGLETKSIEEIVDWIITMATLDRSNIALRDIYTTVATPVERRSYNIDHCHGHLVVDHMKDYILKRFEDLQCNTEYCLKKMSELDGCQKDLKILEGQQEWLVKQISEYETKVSAKDDEISRLKDLINAMNEEVKDM